jgi:hypothetical protein
VTEVTPRTTIKMAMTTNVYGRFRASLTIHMAIPFVRMDDVDHFSQEGIPPRGDVLTQAARSSVNRRQENQIFV